MSDQSESFENAQPVRADASIGRSLPHSLEAEEYLLSCCLLDGPDVVTRCIMAKIRGASFYDQKHGIIFETLLALYAANKPIDVSIVAEELKTAGKLDAVGGYAFLTQVSSRIPTTAQAGYFIDKVLEQATLREIIRSGTGIVEDCHGYSGGLEEFISRCEQKFTAATREHFPEPIKAWPQAIDDAAARAEEIIGGQEDKFAISSFGLEDLDRVFAPGSRGEVIVVAARPSVGKSSFMRGMMKKSARRGLKVLAESLEVPARDIALQMAASDCGIGLRNLRHAHRTDQQRFRESLNALRLRNLHVFDCDRSMRAISARANAIRPDVIFIDYLGLLDDCNPGPGETKAQAVGRAMKAIKKLAVDLNCVVVLLCQLNRASAQDGNREPALSDLRDSGDIEQDADRVIFLHRPNADPISGFAQSSTADASEQPRHYIAAIQAKGRNVGTGIVGIYFQRAIATFIQAERRAA